MNPKIRIKGTVVRDDYRYETPLGSISRIDLVERYAQTIQYCLVIEGSRYSPYKAAEQIMCAVIGLMTPKGPKRSTGHIVTHLRNGLSSLGYFLAEGRYDTRPTSVIPELHVSGKFPLDDKDYTDYVTGEHIGFAGLRQYTELLNKCLFETSRFHCDKAAYQLVQAVRLILEQIPKREKEEIETLLWKALQELDLHLDIAPWYERLLAKAK